MYPFKALAMMIRQVTTGLIQKVRAVLPLSKFKEQEGRFKMNDQFGTILIHFKRAVRIEDLLKAIENGCLNNLLETL